MRIGKKGLLVTVMVMIVTAVFTLLACGEAEKTPPKTTAGAYYLSVCDGGEWQTYTSDSSIPAAKKFTQDAQNKSVYTLVIALDEGALIRIAQVGSTATYGADELLSSQDYLVEGSNNAISVAASGTYTFTFDATDNSITYKYKENGTGPEALLVSIDNVTGAITLKYNDTPKQLTATVTFSDTSTSSEGIEWESSETGVATVVNGLITPVSAGTTVIKASYADIEDTVTVHVNGEVTIAPTDLTLNVGQSEPVVATVAGGAIIYEWASSNEDVATVTQEGVVTGHAAGEAEITLAYYERPNTTLKRLPCAVKVNTPVSRIDLSTTKLTVSLDSPETLTVTISPDDATNQEYSWDIATEDDADAADIVSVTKAGKTLTITGKTVGTVTLTVTSADDDTKTAECVINVVEAGEAIVKIVDSNDEAVDGITLHKTTNSTATLKVSVTNDTVQSVAWLSSTTAVATVTASGETTTVTSVAFGTTTVTATVTLENGGEKKVTCKVLVAPSTFYLYGDYGNPTWSSDIENLTASKMVFAETEQKGIYKLTFDLLNGKNFRIGHDDGFSGNVSNWAWVGLNYDRRDQASFTELGLDYAGDKDNNIKPTVSGNYTLTVDLTDGLAVIYAVRNSIAVTGITVTNTGAVSLKAGDPENNSTTVTLAVQPQNATYTADDITWSCANGDVTLVEAPGKMSVTVTVNDDAATGNAVVKCEVKGKEDSVTISLVAAQGEVQLADKVVFAQEAYQFDVSTITWQDGWTATVSALAKTEDDELATNSNVEYTCDDSGVTVNANSGAVTATKLGTYTITATALDGSGVSEEAKVTFYSKKIYISGDHNSWTPGSSDNFKDDGTHKTFTLKIMLSSGNLSMIAFDGISSWDISAIVASDIAPGSDASASGRNIKVSNTGVFQLTLDLSGPNAQVTYKYLGIVSLVLSAGGGSSSVNCTQLTEDWKYTMTAVAECTAETEYGISVNKFGTTINITDPTKFSGAALEKFDYVAANGTFKCLEDGKYQIDVVLDDEGEYTVTISKVSLGEESTAYSVYLELYYDSGYSESSAAASNPKLYFNETTGIYTAFVTLNLDKAWRHFGITVRSTDGKTTHVTIKPNGADNGATAGFVGANTINDAGLLDSSLYWATGFYSASTTLYVKLEFTAEDIAAGKVDTVTFASSNFAEA
ncbi:MAG: Ig-like domain-containing protein [Clostridiales bacterium]|nr:Ig-like domain-containing protein [Clostridiales bacterium]